MSLISLILVLAFVGFLAWLVLQIEMPAVVQKIIIGVVVIFLVLYVLQQFGVATPVPALKLR